MSKAIDPEHVVALIEDLSKTLVNQLVEDNMLIDYENVEVYFKYFQIYHALKYYNFKCSLV